MRLKLLLTRVTANTKVLAARSINEHGRGGLASDSPPTLCGGQDPLPLRL